MKHLWFQSFCLLLMSVCLFDLSSAYAGRTLEFRFVDSSFDVDEDLFDPNRNFYAKNFEFLDSLRQGRFGDAKVDPAKNTIRIQWNRSGKWFPLLLDYLNDGKIYSLDPSTLNLFLGVSQKYLFPKELIQEIATQLKDLGVEVEKAETKATTQEQKRAFFSKLGPITRIPKDDLLRNEIAPGFPEIGNGEIYLIKDPAGKVPPFVLSDHFPKKPDGKLYTQYEAAGAYRPDGSIDEKARDWLISHNLPLEGTCHGKGALMTKEQLEALQRAGGFNLPGMPETFVWSSSVHPNRADFAFYFNGYNGHVAYVGARVSDLGTVRCVRPVAAW